MFFLEFTKPDGSRITFNVYDISVVEQMKNYTKIVITSGHVFKVKEHSSTVTVDLQFALKELEYAKNG